MVGGIPASRFISFEEFILPRRHPIAPEFQFEIPSDQLLLAEGHGKRPEAINNSRIAAFTVA
jgi:hypothetical protein